MADDISNEVFLDVWRQAGKFEFRSEVTTWLLGIARYKVLSSRRKRREDELDEGEAEQIADGSDTPEVASMKSDKAEALRTCINGLGDDHRTVIDLAYYHGRTVTEIGDILKIPVATVKTRMFYARSKLAEALKAAGYDRGWP